MIGVFIDTIVICTASAIIVTPAPRPDNEYTLNGIQDLQHAMSVLVGGWGAGVHRPHRAAVRLQLYRS